MELTRSRGSSVWSRQEAKLGDNLLSYLTMPPLSTPYGAVAAYRSISRQPYKVYWKILQPLQHNTGRGHCTWRVHPLCNRQPCYTTQASITSTTHGGLAGHTMPQALPPYQLSLCWWWPACVRHEWEPPSSLRSSGSWLTSSSSRPAFCSSVWFQPVSSRGPTSGLLGLRFPSPAS